MKLSEIARLIGGSLIGDEDLEISGASGISQAVSGEITFLADKKYLKELRNSKASAVILKDDIPDISIARIIHPEPYYAFARVLELLYPKENPALGISPLAFVAEGVSIKEGVSIYPFAYISKGVSVGKNSVIYPGVYIGEEASIGDDCIIYPNVVIQEKTKIGDRVIVHPSAVIGSDGFGYTFHSGRHYKIPQVGRVVIGDDVEIGAGTTIDRATTGETIIGRGTKIDNLVQIGHNVKIGEHSIIVAQVGIGGSTLIGDYVTLGGQVGVADHSKIEAGSMVAAQSGIMGELRKGIYAGTPVIAHMDWLKSVSLFARLPEIFKRIKALEEIIQKRGGKND